MKNIYQQLRMVISKVFAATVVEVDKMFPTKADCIDEIYRIIAPELVCDRCSEAQFTHEHGERIASCDTCGQCCYFTAGTPLFDHMHDPKPILTGLIAMKNGVIFNAHMLYRECRISYQSASTVMRKLLSQANEIMEQDSTPVLSSDFDAVICRRSFETEAHRHPRTEGEKEFEDMMAPGEDIVQSRLREVFGTNIDPSSSEEPPYYEDEQVIYDLLERGALTPDEICELSGLSISRCLSSLMTLLTCGLIDELFGGRFKRRLIRGDTMLGYNSTTQERIAHAIEVIRIIFRGVSRRYIQRYLAAYWCFVGRTQADRDKFVKRCCKPLGPTKMDSENYVSPIVLSFPKLFNTERSTYSEYGVDAL